MLKRRWKPLLAGGIVCVVVVLVAGFFWADRQLQRASGALTERVDRTQFAVAPQRLAIVGTNVLSPDGKRMLADRDVLVDGDRIVSVTAASPDPETAFGPGTRVVDGRGRWLVPGFADAHVHLRGSPNDLLLYVANGVTSIAEMGGEDEMLGWREDTRAGAVGPRMFIASRKLGTWGLLDGWYQAWTRRRINVGSPDEAPVLVARLKRKGYDAVKLGTFVDAPTYDALGDAARAADMRLIGHIPLSVSLDDVYASPQQEVAHVEELVKALNMAFGPFNSDTAERFLAYVRAQAPQVAANLRGHGITVATTIWLIDSIPRQKADLAALLGELPMEYANPGLVEGTPLSPGWLPANNPYRIPPGTSDEDRDAIGRYARANVQAHHILLRALVEAGVPVIAGTDADNAVAIPGFSLHDEMQALVDAGMSNRESLQAATSAAGDWLGNRTGRIAPGARADLVLLRGDPLDRIANTRRIDAVVLGGRLLERDRLDAMLAAVEQANRRASRTDSTR